MIKLFKKKQSFDSFLETVPEHTLKMLERCIVTPKTFQGVELPLFSEIPYKVLKREVPAMFEAGQYEKGIYTLMRYSKKKIKFTSLKNSSNEEKIALVFWIKRSYKEINDLEAKWLTTPPDPKLVSAGIRDLNILGDINLIDFLAKGDILKWKKIEKLPYGRIFEKQLKTTIEARIDKKYAEQNKPKKAKK